MFVETTQNVHFTYDYIYQYRQRQTDSRPNAEL